MTITQLVAELNKQSISLSLEGDDLLINYERDEIPELLLESVKNNKQELVAYLKKYVYQEAVESILPAEKAACYPLSPSQHRLWILSQFQTGLTAYNMPGYIRLTGQYNIAHLRQAVRSVLERHEILRTVFRENAEGIIHQHVLDAGELRFDIRYENYADEKDAEQAAKEYIRKDSYLPFDLVNGPLLRICLLKLADTDHILYYNMHHIISDGWSLEIIKRDILAYYMHYAEGRTLNLPQLRIQYKDYASWQLQRLAQSSFIKAKDFWLDKLSGELPVLELPSSRKRAKIKTYNGAGLRTVISKQQTDALRRFTVKQDSTLFVSLLALWNIVLYKYTSERDIILGSPVAGRDHMELEDQIGCFLNTLVLRNEIEPADTFLDCYQKIRDNTLKSIEHQAYPFDRLIDELNFTKDVSRNPVFDVILTLQNTGEKKNLVILEEKEHVFEDTGEVLVKFDLDIFFTEAEDNLVLQVNYNTDLYHADMVKGMMSAFKQVLSEVITHPHKTVSSISYLSAEQQRRLIHAFNDTTVDHPLHKTVIDLFSEQVAHTPDKTAIVFGEKKFTYQQLDTLSTQLANCLSNNYGIGKGDKIGMQLYRSEWVMVSIFAILKAGAVYVPIDPELPDSRKTFIAEDADLKLLISEAAFMLDLISFEKKILYVDINFVPSQVTGVQSTMSLSSDDLAYIIYTSGSTGNPKGVMISHRSLANYLLWGKGYYLNDDLANTNFGLFTALSFDLTITSLFLPLLSGGSLDIASSGNILDILQEYFKKDISCIKLTPAHISLLDGLQLRSDKVQLAIVGGEELRKDHIAILKEINPAIRIINEYGPTETTVGCTVYDVAEGDEPVLIGRPIANTAIYIVDAFNNLQAEGVVGEICIGGAGLAKGYLNQPVLTAEKFIPNPFGDGSIYKTGDIGRWLPDGNIEYRGRGDDQVKIKGYRIEPGEIEHVLAGYDGIKEGVIGVVKDDDMQHRLCAYVVTNERYEKAALIKYLKAALPAYMVPDYYVTLEAIPLSSNGKVDRKNLPAPDLDSEKTSFNPPQTAIQIAVADIWKQVLSLENIGLDDNFYELGGDSLRVIRLISQYHRVFDVKLNADALFEHVTLEAHAALVASSGTEKHVEIPLAPLSTVYPVSDAQEKLWVISQVEQGSVSYNMPGSVKLEGDYDVHHFTRAILSVVERHEILRTVFRKNAEGIVQQIVLTVAESGFTIGHERFTGIDNPELSARAYIQKDSYQPFDLENGPLLRVCLLQLGESDYILYYNMHHIISDGWSMDILTRDILAYYQHYATGAPLELPALRIQYKDYASWQLAQLETPAYEQHKQYWLNKLSGELPVLDMPSAKPRPPMKTYNGRRLGAYLSRQSSDAVHAYVSEKGGTLFMFLIASLKVLFHRYTGQQDLLLGCPVAGRDHAELEDQIGFYINTLAVRSSINGKASFGEFFEQVKQSLLVAYEHQMYPLDRLADQLDAKREGGRNALFDVRVVLLNTGDREVKLAEVANREAIQDHGEGKAKFDMLFIFHEVKGHLALELTYDSDVYDYELMAGFIRHYQQLVDELVKDAAVPIEAITYFPDQEKAAINYDLPAASLSIQEGQTMLDLFAKQVTNNPDNIALVSGDIKWTYHELDDHANQLARYLKHQYNIQGNDLVGIKLPASHWSVVAILGILKAGAGYVPIDTETPVERVQYLVADTQVKALIILSSEEAVANNYNAHTLVLDKEWELIKDAPQTTILAAPATTDLAYVIYTSGSTGQPKGVMITHANLCDYVNGLFANTTIANCERFALMSSIATDLGNTVLYGALLSGGALHVLPKEKLMAADAVHDYFKAHAIDCIKIVPSHWTALSRGEELLLPGRMIVFGGDVLPSSYVEAIHAQRPGVIVVNHYGPTETTIGKLLTYASSQGNRPKIPIGKPFSSTSVYVVDKQMNLCPAGIPGELLIGGKGVARGYLKKPELTNQQFITRNYSGKQERLYRTGDLVRMLPDGNIEFLGRIDNQVKIRGYRIELGDVETALSSVADIDKVLVIARELSPGAKELVAYYTGSLQNKEQDLRAHLLSRLPAYMIPGYFISLKEFPLTSNGKINRKALPDPAQVEQPDAVSITAPRNKEEQVMAEVWESVLKRKGISVHANFFELGGDSIKGILIVSRLKQKGYELKIADLMQTPVLSTLAEKLTLVKREIKQSVVSGTVLLTPIQQAFLSSESYADKSHYNQSVALESITRIDLSLLDKSLDHLVKHHDALRMVFRNEDGKWRQENKGAAHKGYSLAFHDLSDTEDYQPEMRSLCDELQAGISLEHGPLFKAALFRLKNKDCAVLVIHHLVTDGVSWRILLEDLQSIYSNLEKKRTVNLPKKTDSFQRWAKLLSEYAQGAALKEERPYWEEILSAGTAPLCPASNAASLEKGDTKTSSLMLDEATVELLQTKVHRVYNTEINDILLTALAMAIANTFGNKRVILDMEGHGREAIIDGVDITRTVGWFTSIYPFVLAAGEDPADCRSALVQVKESLRRVPHKGVGYGILRHLGGGFDKELIADIVFNYLGDVGGTAEEKEHGLFTFSGEYKGVDSSANNDIIGRKLRISGITLNKTIRITIAFNDAAYDTQQVAALADAYKHALETMIRQLGAETGSYLTPCDLTYKGLSVSELSELNDSNNVQDIYRLSPLQEGLYYHWIAGNNKATYCAQHSYRLHMPGVSLHNIRKSYELLVARHSVLRTGFVVVNGELLQVVRKETEPGFTYEDVAAAVPPEALELYISDYKAKDKERGFEIGQDSLMRLSVLYLGDDKYEFVWTNHHILMDGWCSSILVNEFYQVLMSLHTGSALSLPAVIPYSSYISWLDKVNKAAGIAYWQQYLSDYTENATLPFKKLAATNRGYLARETNLEIRSAQLGSLRNICAQYSVTESILIQSAWGYLLSKYNNTRDVVFGAVVSGRPAEIAGVENMVGLFINTIPARVSYRADMKVSDLLKDQQEASIAGLQHHYLKLSEIQSKSQSGKQLFDHIYVFENYAVNELDEDIKEALAATGNKDKISVVSGQSSIETHYDFDILVAPLKDSIHITFRYNGNVYRQEDMQQMRDHLLNVLSCFIATPQMLLKDVSCITPAEAEQLRQFNNTRIAYPENKTILHLFQEQVSRMPDHAAVVFEDQRLTYKELDEQSGQLAHYLQDNYEVVRQDLVGIQLHRSEKLLVAILGVLKAGAAYVPLDMQYPEERIRFIKEDSQYKVCIDKDFLASFYTRQQALPKAQSPVAVQGTDAAYGIYTSGSTGQPKGVLNSHAGLYNRLLWMRDDLQITHQDIVLQKTPYTFDVSVWELLMPAVTGCRLVFAKPEGHKDPEYLQQLIQSAAVSIIHFVPSMLGIFLENLQPGLCKSLRHVVCSGEALPATMVEEFKRKLPGVRIHNLYGPTEAAIDVTSIDLTDVDTKTTEVTIGKPVANTSIYIVDKNMAQQPVGVCGELLIEGIQVAQKYLNRPDLNEEKFIPSPFTPGERVYRTGDVAKWLPGGEIAYVGRVDDQVKIRGNRIELGEIESAISASGYVDNVAILVKQDTNGHKHLLGYILPKVNYTEDALYAFMKDHLPEYMVPARIRVLDAFPLTSSGKVNRKALAQLEDEVVPVEQIAAPQNETQAELALIWESVLGYKGVSVQDNFFRAGGDSILAIRLISKINAKYHVNLTIAQLYEFSTIEALALQVAQRVTAFEQERIIRAGIEKDIARLKASVLAEIDQPEEIEDIYPMTDIQKGMVILSDLNQQSGVYHDQFSFQIPLVDPRLFKEAFSRLVWKHPTLRTRLAPTAYSTPMQIVRKEEDFTIDHEDLSQLSTPEKIAYIREYMQEERKRPFQVNAGPLWRISLFTVNDHSSIFLFQFHHAILDGWSLASMNTELFNIYRQLKQHLPAPLEKLKATNRDAVVSELYDKRNPETVSFWQTELADFKKLDIFGNEDQNLRLTSVVNFEFKRRLEDRSRLDEVTLKTVIYGAFIYALKLISYESDFVIGVLSNNRPVVEDGEKLLGCFLNTIPIRSRFEHLPQLPLREYFKEVERDVKRISKHDRLTLYEISRIMNERPAGGSPFFDVMFNYVNFHVYNTLGLDADEDYRKSHEEKVYEDAFVLTNTTFDFTANALGNSLTLTYKLRKSLRNEVSLEKIHHYVETILRSYVDNADQVISDLDYLADDEKQLVLQQYNLPDTTIAAGSFIVELFEEQVRRSPENTAVVFGDTSWTYRELHDHSNKLAAYLRDTYAIQADDLVGMKLPSSHWSIVAILGILKAGAAYVPIDAETPAERVQYITADTGIKTLIILSEEEENAKGYNTGILVLDRSWDALMTREASPVQPSLEPHNLAYVIYTSGSTGQPKGVMITHANLCDYVNGLFANTAIANCERFALMSSIATDLGNTVLYGALLSGGALHVMPKEKLLVAEEVHDYFKAHAIDCIKIVPSHWIALSKGEEVLLPGRMIVFGGDVLPASYVEAIHAQRPGLIVVNHYGPTETTIGKLLTHANSQGNRPKIPIGKPFSSTSVYVVDKQMNLCPAGIPGELLIGGKGVARGYLKKPELTNQQFITRNYSGKQERLYRTGDLVRMLPDGNIEFLGRIDNQVKIRGYRIELGDVETAIRSSGLVENAVVLVQQTATARKHLISYIIPGNNYTANALHAHMSVKLPDYMIPVRIIALEEFPLMPNGKIDRKKFLEGNYDREIPEDLVAPRNETETALVAIWEKVLEYNGIGVYDNFFRIGGDSLLILKLKHELERYFETTVNIVDLFNYSTIADQAGLFMKNKKLEEGLEVNELKF